MAMQAISDEPSLELGFALGTGNDFACVDLDDLEKVASDHRDGAAEWQSAIRLRLAPRTYGEVSRSGTGWHFIGRCIGLQLKASVKHPEYHIDLLLKSFLVVTGDHRPDGDSATTEIGDITHDVAGLARRFSEGDGPDAQPHAALPVDATITPAQCSEKLLIARLGGNWKYGDVFKDGRAVHDWSLALSAILKSAAEVTTDDAMVHRVMSRSGFVQLAEDKDGVARADKLDRVWADEWRKALIKTEPSRRAAASSVDIIEYSLADLWELSPYVQFMVKDRAMKMITEGLLQGRKSDELAPLFLYLKDRDQNRLENDMRLNGQPELASICMEARLAALKLHDVTVMELEDSINASVRAVAEMDEKRLYRDYNRRFYMVEHFGLCCTNRLRGFISRIQRASWAA